MPLQKCTRRLKTYTGDEIPVLGECQSAVRYKGRTPVMLRMIVVKGDGPSLLGRDWLKHLKLDWSEIFSLHSSNGTVENSDLEQILHENAEVFEDVRGTIQGLRLAFTLTHQCSLTTSNQGQFLTHSVKR